MITVVTFLRGGIANPYPLEYFKFFPEGTKLIATVTNQGDYAKVQELGGRPVWAFGGWDGQGGEEGRHRYVATLYNLVIPLVKTEKVFVFNDDIIPTPPDIDILTLHPLPLTAAGICGMYPFRGTTEYPVFFSPVICPLPESSLPSDEPVVFAAAMGFSIWKTDILKSALPLEVLMMYGSPMGTEIDLGHKMHKACFNIHVHGSVRVQHVNL